MEAARWLAAFISSAWTEPGRPCPEAVVDLAVRCAAAREAAFDPGRAVLVRRDVHAFNGLQVPEAGPVQLSGCPCANRFVMQSYWPESVVGGKR
jgi:hypothetical protein